MPLSTWPTAPHALEPRCRRCLTARPPTCSLRSQCERAANWTARGTLLALVRTCRDNEPEAHRQTTLACDCSSDSVLSFFFSSYGALLPKMSFFAADSDEVLDHQRLIIKTGRGNEDRIGAWNEHSNNEGQLSDVHNATFLATVSVAQAVDQLAKDVKIEHVKFDKANETGAARAREADAAWLPVFLCRAQTPALWRTRSEHQ
ncbi:hypothetical protein OF846_003986 [Rhodotorula toruloides]|nr:hypothetical protein OF846_003986 [Rhodotorula toruloides]